jgi:RND family efflux transporter MFP subunit
MNEEKYTVKSGVSRWILFIVGLLLLAGAGGIGLWLLKNKPIAKRRKAVSLIPKVQVQELKKLDVPVLVSAMGVVVPSKKATLRARISGEVQKMHEDLEPGGIVKKDDTILWIDDADYKLHVQVKEAALKKVESALLLELVQQRVAVSQLKSYSNQKSENLDKDMILRKPQERSCRADIMAAKADLDDAKLDLSRTSIKAPFNAVVLERDVDVGEQADLARVLVTVVGIDTYWIKVSIPVNALKWIEFPENGHQKGSDVEINCRRGIRKGKVLRLMSSLDSKGRMAQILIEVKDPLDLKSAAGKRVPLLLEEYVRVSIKGKVLKNVVEVPRKAFHNNQSIWLMTPKGSLDIFDVTPVWDVRNAIYVDRKNFPEGKLITSDLGFPVKGMSISAVEPNLPEKVLQTEKEKKTQ